MKAISTMKAIEAKQLTAKLRRTEREISRRERAGRSTARLCAVRDSIYLRLQINNVC